MKSNIKFIFIALLIFSNLYSQNEKNQKYDLSSSVKSFEVLTNILIECDTVNLKFVVAKETFKKFNFKSLSGLQKLGIGWKGKNVVIIKKQENEEILKIEDQKVPLKFIREENGDWKFLTFTLNN